MSNVFTPRANFIARASIVVILLGLTAVSSFVLGFARSSFSTGVGVEVSQPVPFSHQHHVAGLGIDCRYCHTTVEESAFAGIPATQTCMNCHSKLWTDAPMLEPIRESWRTGAPVCWQRVHDLPDFVYFDHSVHLAKGIGCTTCHGRVDQMPLVRKDATLFMSWCLDCHRDPWPHVRPRDELFSMEWQPLEDDLVQRDARSAQHDIRTQALADCSICHR